MSNWIDTQLALIRADIEEIRHVLFGNSKGRKGLVEKVKELARVTHRRRFVLRVALWSGGAIAIIAMGITHLNRR